MKRNKNNKQDIKSDNKEYEWPIPWELQVYRNTHRLCVYCGEPMTTTVFHDVPVCDKHKNEP